MHRFSRRQVLQVSLAIASVSLFPGCAPPSQDVSPPTVPRIGILAPSLDDNLELVNGLAELGYVEGQNIAIEYRTAGEMVDQLLTPAAELVSSKVDLIVAIGTPAVTAARRTTSTLPIVMAQVSDPVGSGFINSLARPGGNITGMTNFGPVLSGKRLELIREVIPGLARVIMIWNPDNPAIGRQVEDTRRAAQAVGIEVRPFEVSGPEDLPGIFESASMWPAEAGIIPRSGFSNTHRAILVDLAAKSRLPVMFVGRDFAAAGGLMAFGPKQAEMFTRVAAAVDRILKGARPADLPVEQPTMFDLVINLRTAAALGLTIPRSVLVQATELIQ